MKHFLVFISLICFSLVVKAQNENSQLVARDLTATLAGKNLQLSWGADTEGSITYWEVQGSRDGKNFSTIGLVLGSDPASKTTNFIFRQENKKLAPGLKYYRVLGVESETRAIASNMILLSK